MNRQLFRKVLDHIMNNEIVVPLYSSVGTVIRNEMPLRTGPFNYQRELDLTDEEAYWLASPQRTISDFVGFYMNNGIPE